MQPRYRIAILVALVAVIGLWGTGAALLPSGSGTAERAKPFYAPPGGEPIAPLPGSLALDARKVALGKRLFSDKRLSRDDSVACSSCHDLAKAGVDGLRRSVGIGGQIGDRNAPTVFNAVFNFRQFWDGRAATLEEQIDGPVHNPKEMASSWHEVIGKLRADDDYVSGFRAVYGSLEARHIKNAIAEFERSLITPGARFDRYLAGARDALAPEELKGYELFKSYGCVACHQGVNIGGNLYERLGVMRLFFKGAPASAATNLGREAVTGKAEDRYVFKVPSLRNVALTAPYFHDGSVATLEEAVLIMGRYQLGIEIPQGDIKLIVIFLHTLTGEYAGAQP
jgi:cytochrome c peroxidase